MKRKVIRSAGKAVRKETRRKTQDFLELLIGGGGLGGTWNKAEKREKDDHERHTFILNNIVLSSRCNVIKISLDMGKCQLRIRLHLENVLNIL